MLETTGENAVDVAEAPEAAPADATDTGEASESAESAPPAPLSLEDQINAATETAMAEMAEDAKRDKITAEIVEDKPADEPDPAEDLASEKPAAAEPVAISDELIERAVRAGLSMKDAKQCPSETFLESMCSRIEGVGGDSGSHSDAGAGEDTPVGAEELLSEIPDLDPEEYGESLADAFKTMKDLIQRQQETISSHSKDRSTDWISAKLEGVKNLTNGDAGKSASVRKKFEAFKAGYKAAGEDVSDDVVFDEAAKLVLGEEMQAAKLAKKGTAAKRRSANHIQRPTGKGSEIKPDVESETADAIDRMHNMGKYA